MTDSNAAPSELQNLNEERTGVAKRRVPNAQSARSIVERTMAGDKARNEEQAKMQGLFDGNRPYKIDKLSQYGRKWQSNVNFQEAESAAEGALQPYYDIQSSSRHRMEIQIDSGDAGNDNQLAQVVTEETDIVIDDFEWWEDEFQAALWDMVIFGKGFLFFDAPGKPEFRHVPQHSVRVLDGTSKTLKKLDLMVVSESKRIHELWQMSQQGTGSHWNKAALMRAIELATPNSQEVGATEDRVEMQRQIYENDLYVSSLGQTVKISHLYVRELSSKKISHYILTDDTLSSSKGDSDQFLFEDNDAFDDWPEIFRPFWMQPRTGTWHGAAGLGRQIMHIMEIKNRLKNRAVDGAFMRGGLTLRAKSASALQKQSMSVIGGANVIGPDFEAVQANIYGNIAEVMAVDRSLEDTVSSNTGTYRTRLDKPQGNPRTAQEVRLQFATQSVLSSSAVARYYSQLDQFYKEVWKRLKNTNELRKRLKKKNFPMEFLDKTSRIIAMRLPGNGSQFMRQENAVSLKEFLPMMPEEGRIRYLQDAAAAFATYREANRYFPDPDLSQKPNDHVWVAEQENHFMQSGVPPSVTGTHNHVIHLQEHFKYAAGALNSVSRGADVDKVLVWMEAFGIHSTRHFEALASDPSRAGATKQLKEQFQQIAKLTDELRSSAQDAKKQQQKTANQGRKVDLESQIRKAESDARIETMRNESNARIGVQRDEHLMSMREKALELATKAAQPASP